MYASPMVVLRAIREAALVLRWERICERRAEDEEDRMAVRAAEVVREGISTAVVDWGSRVKYLDLGMRIGI